jgi:hypothetical protein
MAVPCVLRAPCAGAAPLPATTGATRALGAGRVGSVAVAEVTRALGACRIVTAAVEEVTRALGACRIVPTTVEAEEEKEEEVEMAEEVLVDPGATAIPTGGRCIECGADVDCATSLCCVNWRSSWAGLPPCGGIFCPSCFCGDPTYFHTVRPDGGGMACAPAHALQRGFMCPLCRLRGLLGRELTGSPSDTRLSKCLTMAMVDGFNHAAPGTLTRYIAHHNAFAEWLPGDFDFFAADAPAAPPTWDPVYVVLMHLTYATSMFYTRGRTSCGGGVVYGTAVSRVNGIYLRDGADGAVARALRASDVFTEGKSGLRRRVGSNPVQNRPIIWPTYVNYLGELAADALPARARVALVLGQLAELTARAETAPLEFAESLAALRAELRRARLWLLDIVSHRLLMFIMTFGGTRGTEPFRLKYSVWREGLFDEAACRRLGIVDEVTGEPLPQMRLGWQVSKTHQAEKTECVVAAVSASGFRILDCALEVAELLSVLELTSGGLFYDRFGRPRVLGGPGGFLEAQFRPLLRRLRDGGDVGMAGCTDEELRTRYAAWSIRRFAETWLAASAPGIPKCPEAIGDLHMGWVVNVTLYGRTALRYRDYSAADKHGVVGLHM